MKGLDTPVLLDLLRGRPSATRLLSALRGEELGTTEINIFELEALVNLDSGPGSDRRRAAVERLRHRLSVVPVDENAVRAAAQLSDHLARRGTPATRLMLGALIAAGCTDCYTTSEVLAPGKHGSIRIVRYAQ